LESLPARRQPVGTPAAVDVKDDVMEAAASAVAGVVDARRIDLGPRLAVGAGVGEIGVVDRVPVKVDLLLQVPAEGVSAGRIVQAGLRVLTVDRARAALLGDFPPV